MPNGIFVIARLSPNPPYPSFHRHPSGHPSSETGGSPVRRPEERGSERERNEKLRDVSGMGNPVRGSERR